jgi:hypothetical protein
VIDTVKDVEEEGIVKELTVGTVVSGIVTVTVTKALLLADTLPAASLAHAYSVLLPAVVNVYVEGADDVQPPAVATGLAEDSLT